MDTKKDDENIENVYAKKPKQTKWKLTHYGEDTPANIYKKKREENRRKKPDFKFGEKMNNNKTSSNRYKGVGSGGQTWNNQSKYKGVGSGGQTWNSGNKYKGIGSGGQTWNDSNSKLGLVSQKKFSEMSKEEIKDFLTEKGGVVKEKAFEIGKSVYEKVNEMGGTAYSNVQRWWKEYNQ